MVEGPLAESPAEESGIICGQRVVEIQGYPADLLTPLEIAALMRGPAGSEVLLAVADNAPHSKPRRLLLERRPLPQPPLKVVRLVVLRLLGLVCRSVGACNMLKEVGFGRDTCVCHLGFHHDRCRSKSSASATYVAPSQSSGTCAAVRR